MLPTPLLPTPICTPDILKEQGYGATFTSSLKKKFFNICRFTIVKDKDTLQTAPYGRTTAEELISLTQEGLNLQYGKVLLDPLEDPLWKTSWTTWSSTGNGETVSPITKSIKRNKAQSQK